MPPFQHKKEQLQEQILKDALAQSPYIKRMIRNKLTDNANKLNSDNEKEP